MVSLPSSFIESALSTRFEYEASLKLPDAERAAAEKAATARKQAASSSAPLQYEGNNFAGAVLPGRPTPPSDLPSGIDAMRIAVSEPAEPLPSRPKCDVLLFISSAAGYERRRKAQRATYLSLLRGSTASGTQSGLGGTVQYRFLLGAPKPEQAAALAAEQAEHGDLLQVAVPESYETLFPKIVAAWRWAVAHYDFKYWMHADDDSFVRPDLLLRWLRSPAAGPPQGLYAGYIWDGSPGRRTKPLRDPAAKSYMPVDQWPHDSYPPFASGCGFVISEDLVQWLVQRSPTFTFFRVIDVPVGVYLAQAPPGRVRVIHVPEIRPYRPLPLFRADTIVQHYMQPEEFRQFHANAYEADDRTDAAALESEARIAQVYDLFVGAKVMRR